MTDQETDREVWEAVLQQRRDAALAKWAHEVPPRFAQAKWQDVDEQLLAAWEPASGANLLLSGSVGSGKTWAMWAAMREAALLGRSWQVIRWPDFVDSLRPGSDRAEGADPLGAMKRCDVLGVDEFGSGRMTEFVLEVLEQLTDYRWRHDRQMVITTNLSVNKSGDLAEWTGERAWSRLTDGATRFVLAGESRRGNHGLSAR